jgi:hypothetical protein
VETLDLEGKGDLPEEGVDVRWWAFLFFSLRDADGRVDLWRGLEGKEQIW